MDDFQYPKVYLYRRIVQAKLYVDQNFSERIDLDNIADTAFFSKFHFMRLFKKSYGRTPHQYLTFVRIGQARQLLQKGLPVSEVCNAVGFDSISSFTGLFKKTTGMTPSAYQSIEMQKKAEIEGKPLKFVPNCFAEKRGWSEESISASKKKSQ